MNHPSAGHTRILAWMCAFIAVNQLGFGSVTGAGAGLVMITGQIVLADITTPTNRGRGWRFTQVCSSSRSDGRAVPTNSTCAIKTKVQYRECGEPRTTTVIVRPGFAENIRAKVHQGVLPPGMPVKIAVLFGDGRACSACDEPMLKAQTRYKFAFSRLGTFSFHLNCFGLYAAELCRQGWLQGVGDRLRPLMLSEAAELLLAAFAPFHEGICVDCGARALERSREESLKATKELIANGYALAGFDACALCDEVTLVTRLRIPSS